MILKSLVIVAASLLAGSGEAGGSGESMAQGRMNDLAIFRQAFLDKDRSYAPAARARAEAMLSALEARAGELSAAEFELRLAQIVALANNGHTLYFTGPWQKRYKRVPLKFVVLDERLFVGAAPDAHSDLVGLEVLSLDGRAWPAVRAELAQYQGGSDAWRRAFVHFFLESPEIMHAAGLANSPEHLHLRGKDPQGRPVSRKIPAASMASDLEGMELYIPPARILELSRAPHLDPARPVPLYLRDPTELFRFEWLDGGVAYVQFRSNTSRPADRNAATFSQEVLDILRRQRPRHVIVDQRFNSGGDLNTTRELMQSLPNLVADGGKVFALTSGNTFSAGISSVAYLEQAGGDQVLIVGEPVGDALEFWAEGGIVELPHTGGMILYADERHNYMTGCPEEDCHGSIQRAPIRVETLEPDIRVVTRYADFASGHDPVLARVHEELARAR